MLHINNLPLPAPYALQLQPKGPGQLKVSAAWRALSAQQLQQVLGPTLGTFTLTCPDPVLGAARGFSAELTHYKAAADGQGTWDLDATLEEAP